MHKSMHGRMNKQKSDVEIRVNQQMNVSGLCDIKEIKR